VVADGWEAQHTSPALRVLGAALIAAGLFVLVQASACFVVEDVITESSRFALGGPYPRFAIGAGSSGDRAAAF